MNLNKHKQLAMKFALGYLADPAHCTDNILIKGEDYTVLIKQLRDMIKIRKTEEKIADNIINKKIKCPCHLSIGQEAIAVSVAASLNKDDKIFGTHRSHAHFLSLGGELKSLFAEVLGKYEGCSRGMGGSMHLHDEAIGFIGSVPIVSGTIPLAVGAALTMKMAGNGNIGVTYFGDGATEEGVFHESLNYASTFNLPVLFVCENNLFSSHLHIDLRQPAESIARFAHANCIRYSVVDGNDVVQITREARRLINHARESNEPVFLECVTYRWRGHVGPSEDIDVGLKRKENLNLWKKRDPISRLKKSLEAENYLKEGDFNKLCEEVNEEIERAWKESEASPYPNKSNLIDFVYS